MHTSIFDKFLGTPHRSQYVTLFSSETMPLFSVHIKGHVLTTKLNLVIFGPL